MFYAYLPSLFVEGNSKDFTRFVFMLRPYFFPKKTLNRLHGSIYLSKVVSYAVCYSGNSYFIFMCYLLYFFTFLLHAKLKNYLLGIGEPSRHLHVQSLQ